MPLAYLHGFASGPASRKAAWLGARLHQRGEILHRPDLNRPSFPQLTYTAALEQIDDLDLRLGGDEPWCFVGSSMGGFLAARWAEKNPGRVARLLLLCPGFDMAQRWPELFGDRVFGRWAEQGFLRVPDAQGEPARLHWGFVLDARTHPQRPAAPVPIRIIHGTKDQTVPIESSRRYCQDHDQATLIEVDDDHSLMTSLDVIWEQMAWLAGWPDEATEPSVAPE